MAHDDNNKGIGQMIDELFPITSMSPQLCSPFVWSPSLSPPSDGEFHSSLQYSESYETDHLMSNDTAPCNGEMRQMVVVNSPEGNVSVLDLNSRFSLPPTLVTKRPKLQTCRMIAVCDQYGRLVCKSYDAAFGHDFDFSPSADSPFADFAGCLVSKIQGKQAEKFVQFEVAATQNKKLNGYIGLKTARAAVKNVFMELVPLNPSNPPKQGNAFLIKLSHTSTRGFTSTLDQFKMKFYGEEYTPVRVAQRKRTVTRKERNSKNHESKKRNKNREAREETNDVSPISVHEANSMINAIQTPNMAAHLNGFLVGSDKTRFEETDIEITSISHSSSNSVYDHSVPLSAPTSGPIAVGFIAESPPAVFEL